MTNTCQEKGCNRSMHRRTGHCRGHYDLYRGVMSDRAQNILDGKKPVLNKPLYIGGKCRNGHVMTEGTMAIDNRGSKYCRICRRERSRVDRNKLKRPSRILDVGSVCKNGHVLDVSMIGRDNRGLNFCIPCDKDRKRRYNEKHVERLSWLEYYNEANMPVDKDAPRRFERALADTDTPCKSAGWPNNGWISWSSDPEDNQPEPPSRQDARLMCQDCPLLTLCAEAALVEKPYFGVRAGLIFDNGKRIK